MWTTGERVVASELNSGILPRGAEGASKLARHGVFWDLLVGAKNCLLIVVIKRRVEGHGVGLEIDLFDESCRFGATMHTIHAAIFPLN